MDEASFVMSHPMNADSIGSRIRKLRIDQGLSQEQLARDSGIATRTLQLLESEASEPRIETARKIAAALGVEPGELFFPTEAAS